MNGKDFERVCIERMELEAKRGRAMMVRYGVQASRIEGKEFDRQLFVDRFHQAVAGLVTVQAMIEEIVEAAKLTVAHYQPMQSLPDFAGVIARRGQAFDFDAKVCNQASFPLDKESKSQSRQLGYMLKRSTFGAICFYLIHFPAREFKTKANEPEQTWAFPIHPAHQFWIQFDRNEVKRINRGDCQTYAVLVPWNTSGAGKKPRPDIVEAVMALAEGGFVSAVVAEPAKPF